MISVCITTVPNQYPILPYRELCDVMSTPKGQQRPDAPDTVKLMDLLVMKDKEIKENLRIGSYIY